MTATCSGFRSRTSAQEIETPSGSKRYPVALVTSGGNTSWSGKVKRIDPDSVDYLFALTIAGRRWCIPTAALEAFNEVRLGGRKYTEHEIEPTAAIREVVFSGSLPLDCQPRLGEYPSGQRTAPVKRQAQPSQVRILPPPSNPRFKPTSYERKPGQHGQAVINQKRRVTIPVKAVAAADLRDGDRIKATAVGHGRIMLERIELPSRALADLDVVA